MKLNKDVVQRINYKFGIARCQKLFFRGQCVYMESRDESGHFSRATFFVWEKKIINFHEKFQIVDIGMMCKYSSKKVRFFSNYKHPINSLERDSSQRTEQSNEMVDQQSNGIDQHYNWNDFGKKYVTNPWNVFYKLSCPPGGLREVYLDLGRAVVFRG